MAYRLAAAEAIGAAEIVERTVDEDVKVKFEYPMMNEVMKVVKDMEPQILSQDFEMDCRMTLRIRKGEAERMKEKLKKIETLSIED